MKNYKKYFAVLLLVVFIFPLISYAQQRGPRGFRPKNFSPRNERPLKKNRDQPQKQVSSTLKEIVPASVGSIEAPLLFGVGIHIEPAIKERKSARNNMPTRNYLTNDFYFKQHEKNLKEMAGLAQKYGGYLTIQAQSPFTDKLIKDGSNLFKEFVAQGHEVGLHFHENVYLGENGESRPASDWTKAMQDQIALIKKTGVTNINYFSGGNLYPHLIKAAADAGLTIMGDYKNRKQQVSDSKLMTVNPWRPKAGPKENDVTDFATHDSSGPIVYLPDGAFLNENFDERKTLRSQEGWTAYFDYMTKSLVASLKACQKDKVNVFRLTLHPGELTQRKIPGDGMAVFNEWLSKVIYPLVQDGRIKWATYSQMANAYKNWEKENPGVEPRANATINTNTESQKKNNKANISFIINVHDIKHVNESANVVTKLVKLFQTNNVRGDFYLTAPMVQLYKQKRPDVIKLLKDTNMTISYHMRPPHPCYNGFDSKLKSLTGEALKTEIKNYETYALNMTTGDYNLSEPGGYSFVKDVFGKSPVTVAQPNKDRNIKKAHLEILKNMGAKAFVKHHETGTKINNPYEFEYGLLIRPSDFSVTRWKAGQMRRPNFWWNMLDKPEANSFDPIRYFESQMSEWQADRAPFVTVLIHENNFYRSGATPWGLIYFKDKNKKQTKSAPYDLNATDPSKARSAKNQEQIFKAYEAFLEYAAKNHNVVTSEDIVKMAEY